MEIGRDLGDAHTSTEVHLADGVRLLYAGEIDAAVQRFTEALADHLGRRAARRVLRAGAIRGWPRAALQAELVDPAERRRPRPASSAAPPTRPAGPIASPARTATTCPMRCANERSWPAAGHSGAGPGAGSPPVCAPARPREPPTKTALTREAMATARRRPGARPRTRTTLTEVELERMQPRAPGAAGASRPPTRWPTASNSCSTSGAASARRCHPRPSTRRCTRRRCSCCGATTATWWASAMPSSEPADERLGQHGARHQPRTSCVRRWTRMAPVVSGSLGDVDESDSMLLADLRSILCAPIVSEGRVVACFNVTHHRLDDLFGDVEIQLAEFIATLAGAALERVAGSEAHFRSLAQNSSDVTTVVDRTGRITYQSSSVEQVFGFAPDELTGRDLASWLHPEDAAQLLAYLDPEAYDEPGNGLVQARMRHRDGSWRVGESAVRSLFDDPSVEGLVLNTRDASERVALEAELRERASHDPLTGLANRSLFVDRVEEAFARRRRHGQSLAVIFLDLDDFKSINDTLGHGGGRPAPGADEHPARAVRATRRHGGAVGRRRVRPAPRKRRHGGRRGHRAAHHRRARTPVPHQRPGDPVPGQRRRGRRRPTARPRRTCCSAPTSPCTSPSHAASLGTSSSRPRCATPPSNGPRCGPTSNGRSSAASCPCVYQPIVEISDGSLRGFEALLRWRHPTRGDLAPDQWIRLAEGSGMIIAIGRWVLRNACQQVAEWRRTNGLDLFVAVNVSARQLQDPGFVDEIGSRPSARPSCGRGRSSSRSRRASRPTTPRRRSRSSSRSAHSVSSSRSTTSGPGTPHSAISAAIPSST